LRNVPRAWSYETGLALGEDLADGKREELSDLIELPKNEYLEYFGPEYKLHFPVSNMENQNSKGYLEENL
jgi:histone deacetylase 1/2